MGISTSQPEYKNDLFVDEWLSSLKQEALNYYSRIVNNFAFQDQKVIQIKKDIFKKLFVRIDNLIHSNNIMRLLLPTKALLFFQIGGEH